MNKILSALLIISLFAVSGCTQNKTTPKATEESIIQNQNNTYSNPTVPKSDYDALVEENALLKKELETYKKENEQNTSEVITEDVATVDDSQPDQSTEVKTESNPSQIISSDNTAKVIEYNFIDHTAFSKCWHDGVFRCGTDFTEGTYYILPLYGAGAGYEISTSPNDFSYSGRRLLRKIDVKNGEYVKIDSDAIMVLSNEVDTTNWQKYGVFLVGKDLPEGDYKIETIIHEYSSNLTGISGNSGAYQINEHSVESSPIKCDLLWSTQEYITLKNGQYIIITNTRLTLIAPNN